MKALLKLSQCTAGLRPLSRVQRRMIFFSGQFFHIFEIIIFCFVVAICDLVHTVEDMYGLP